jgi:VCBS repeat protein/FG-GAP repeat protein
MAVRHRFLSGVTLFLLLAVAPAAARATPPAAIVTGQDAGWPAVNAWTIDGRQADGTAPWGAYQLAFSPYPTYQQGLRVAVGDVNGDGKPEIVTAPAQGGWTDINVFDGKTYRQLASFPPFGNGSSEGGGAFVATGDTTGDGRAEIITGIDAYCCTQVHVLDGPTGNDIAGFYPFGPSSQVGARVAAADLNGDGRAELLVSANGSGTVEAFGPGGGQSIRTLDLFSRPADVSMAVGDVVGDARPELVAAANTPTGPQVKVVDPRTGDVLASLYPFAANWALPQVAVGDVNGDGRADVIALAQSADGTEVKEFDMASGKQLGSFFVLEPGVVPGASLAAGDLDGDGKAELVLGGGPTAAPLSAFVNGPDQRVAVYRSDGTLVGGFNAYPGLFQGGVRVGFGNLGSDGKNDIVTAPGPGMAPEVDVYAQDWVATRDRGTRLAHFLAYEPTFRGGVSVAVGSGSIVTAPGAGRPSDIHVYDGAGNLRSSFRAFEDSYVGGVSVATGDLNDDGRPEIVVGTLAGTPRVRAFNADGTPYGPVVTPFADGGVEVAVADLLGSGYGIVLAGAASGSNPQLALLNPASARVLRVVRPLPDSTSGLRVAAGDLNHDGRDEVVVAPGFGGDSTIHVLGPNLAQQSAFRANGYNGNGYNVAVAARLGLPIRAQSVTSRFIVKRRLTRLVARFVDAGTADGLPTARVVWSDGVSTSGVVVSYYADTYDVRATRRFTQPGRLHLTVTFSSGDGRTSVAHSAVIVRRS